MPKSPLFASKPQERRRSDSWKVLIVDDEQGVHDVTTLALKRFVFQEKSISFYHAFSGKECIEVLKQHPDMSLVLLDVVMEEDDAGLTAAKYIRDGLNNKFVRIVLRTGQPGSAPEEEVIRDYDINDYKDKTELTIQKLKTMMYSSLRSYRDLLALEQHRIGLNRVIESTADMFQRYQLNDFASGLLVQISSVLGFNSDVVMAANEENSIFLAGCEANPADGGMPRILTGTGRFYESRGLCVSEVLREPDLDIINRAIEQQSTVLGENQAVFFFKNNQGHFGLVYLTGIGRISKVNRDLMQLFTQNISIAYENISLYQEIDDTHREILIRLGNVAEFRSREVSHHIKRVAEYSELLARKAGMDEDEARLIRQASPMHDIGKLGIPDSILHKPGPLSDEEFDFMKQHCQIGHDMMQGSERPILKTASIIALEHQEKWDGTGYPRGLKGEEIHIYGRITAICDVFDALGAKRCYKESWQLEKVVYTLKEQKGIHFDPDLVDLFLNNLDEFLLIRGQFDSFN